MTFFTQNSMRNIFGVDHANRVTDCGGSSGNILRMDKLGTGFVVLTVGGGSLLGNEPVFG